MGARGRAAEADVRPGRAFARAISLSALSARSFSLDRYACPGCTSAAHWASAFAARFAPSTRFCARTGASRIGRAMCTQIRARRSEEGGWGLVLTAVYGGKSERRCSARPEVRLQILAGALRGVVHGVELRHLVGRLDAGGRSGGRGIPSVSIHSWWDGQTAAGCPSGRKRARKDAGAGRLGAHEVREGELDVALQSRLPLLQRADVVVKVRVKPVARFGRADGRRLRSPLLCLNEHAWRAG